MILILIDDNDVDGGDCDHDNPKNSDDTDNKNYLIL
jgi:hypothetical protein